MTTIVTRSGKGSPLTWDEADTNFTNLNIDKFEVTYTTSETGGVERTTQSKFEDLISVKDFGAVGDGVTDDTAAIQAALDLGVSVYAPIGIYRTTSELVLKTGSKLIGAGAFSAFANSDSGGINPLYQYSVGNTVILYDGTASSTACIVRASSQPVGTEPTDTDTRNLINIGLSNITLNGNGKAGIGLYVVRAMCNNTFDSITVTRTTSHAFLVMISFIGSAKRWAAWLNEGCGITIGRNVFSWASNNTTVDEIHFDSLIAQYNGHSATRTPLGGYSKAVNYENEYGIGIYQGRAIKFTNLQSIHNGGVGIYCYVDRWPINIDTFYVEYNCESDVDIPTNGRFGIWVQGYPGSVSRHIQFQNGYMSGTGTTLGFDGIRLTGTEPSRRGEDAVILQQISLLRHIEADWGNYRLIDSDSTVVITGTSPYMIQPVLNGQLNLSVTGSAAVQIAAGAIIVGAVYAGIISSVTYDGVGLCTVNFNATLPTQKYTALLTGSDNRVLGITNKTTTGFTITSYNTSTALSDSSYINVLVVGYYEI